MEKAMENSEAAIAYREKTAGFEDIRLAKTQERVNTNFGKLDARINELQEELKNTTDSQNKKEKTSIKKRIDTLTESKRELETLLKNDPLLNDLKPKDNKKYNVVGKTPTITLTRLQNTTDMKEQLGALRKPHSTLKAEKPKDSPENTSRRRPG